MKQLSILTTAELKDAALDVVGEYGEIESWQIPDKVASRLGGSTDNAESLGVRSLNSSSESRAARERFSGRVRRVLDLLAAEGTIVKIGANQTLPSGFSSRNIAHYYTHPAYEAAMQRRSAPGR